tara:strand:+ start:391 stop:642 length:252 start_codon:yes stop_codon:yes gene_type:complete
MTLKKTQELLAFYKDAYCSLVARAYITCLVYERYLLDKATHVELAEEMKEMLESLPDEILSTLASDTPLRDSEIPPKPSNEDY